MINLGGPRQTIYKFVKKENKVIQKSYLKKNKKIGIPFDSSLNLKKLNSIIKKR